MVSSIPSPEHPLSLRLLSALFYGIASLAIVFVNKILLTNLGFPSFLVVGLGQMASTVIILRILSLFRKASIPSYDNSIIRKIFPLPLIYIINLITGLGGTQAINLPMFTVLRRFSIAMTMGLEYVVLGVVASYAVRLSVFLMIAGSIVAAIYDLAFDLLGYTYILANDVATAANGVYMKKKLDAKDLGKDGLLYYNCLIMFPPALALAIYTGDVEKTLVFYTSGQMTFSLWLCFGLSCVCGFILNYSLILCTHYNSALTTTCIGPIKNLLVTYAGMFTSGDFVFGWANFLGINISVFGSIIYTYVTFRSSSSKNRSILVSAKSVEKRPLV
ncbi:hypothetical protein PFISCL1PPCAC_6087 [Pristionchus fissidentatus]|uniref:Sugar phosphate transporter domain-containing protein n=1 Tax=Pristionchus fissidentatus TaxID=1538716 RepID=A0AAV5VA71_9BILA|nr:hypothetical protein PFISCL1PPCAC_6087 [Pristionchus fissidentatus]